MRKRKTGILAAMLAFFVIFTFPLLFLLAVSLMGEQELNASFGNVLYEREGEIQWKLFPLYPTLRAYIELLLDSPGFFVMFWNSCKQTFLILAGQFLTGIPAAWAFGRFRFWGRRALFFCYMLLMVLPFQVTMVSSYTALSSFRLLDTCWAVILPGMFSAFPVFIMTKFFQGIPEVLFEAARVDGAGQFRLFFHIGLPLGLPGIFSSGILNFLEYWNSVEPPMTFLKTPSKFPVSLYLGQITVSEMGTAFAASVMILAPALFLFAWGQSYLEQGILASGLKE